MKIAVIGAGGRAGKLILKEALDRGHEAAAIVRDRAKAADSRAAVLEKDLFDLTRDDLRPFDAVVNAFGARAGEEHLHVKAGNILIEAITGSVKPRLVVIGGAGSLYVDEAESVRVIDTPDFPREYYEMAFNQAKNLDILRQTADLEWTFVSPSAIFALGKRTGSYRSGRNRLLLNSTGQSYVSYEDFAIAILDEIENPQHRNSRFTVVSEAE